MCGRTSIGRWEGYDTFVVNSVGFNDRTWLGQEGQPHSDEMRLEERWERVDRDTLHLNATIDDPFIRIGRYFLPGAKVEEVPAYQGWDAIGLLDVTDGNVTDFEEIEHAILEAGSRFQVDQVAFDPDYDTLPLSFFEPMVREVFARPASGFETD